MDTGGWKVAQGAAAAVAAVVAYLARPSRSHGVDAL